MTESQIIDDWFSKKENTDKLPTYYSNAEYLFIEVNAEFYKNLNGTFYNVFGVWQRIVIENNKI